MAPFPVVVRELSRFTGAAEAEATMAGIADGSVDIVIGTHRILQQTVRFKDLGLVVGDADPEDARNVAHRDPRDDDDPHPARGTPPDPDVCGYAGSAADRRGDSPRAVT